MSYNRELEDYSDAELQIEIERRTKLRAAGMCDYCERPLTSHTCKKANAPQGS